MYYNNTGVSDNENRVGVWDSHYLMVFHLEKIQGVQRFGIAQATIIMELLMVRQ